MRTKTQASDLARRFQWLITKHGKLRSKEALRLTNVLDELFPRFHKARKDWAESQRESADEFNLFEVMEVERDEVGHSKILAWLLDHRIEHGTHPQGNLGFRLLLKELAPVLQQQD